ncbi:hypothetical protein [Clostridium beijerinckii]|uniref:hypothetical protein n=1 Tax=Clostridium beijerinckii TaxID=1520 RepID=UPI0015703F93|nr:hypothetical protein [Clostridium beijerinckii]NRU52560.1 hypothetical protein [Clostridium beijerinckii]NYC69263.1 hypothetical protein [Clostridium beijerinckii]NYC91761.1 hypothetical protein [Clostridium beijerinckii]
MTVTDYDTIWETFRDISGLDDELLPSDEQGIYLEIHNAVRKYNIKTDDSEEKLTYSDETETLNKFLDDNRLQLLALFIKQNILQSKLEYFEQLHQYDLKEVKSKFYREQVSARQSTIEKVDKEIKELLSYMDDHDLN